MKNDLIFDKDDFIRLIMSNIEYNSSTSERAIEYLQEEGLDVNAITSTGMKRINELLRKYSTAQKDKASEKKRLSHQFEWKHESVRKLISESNNPNPIEEIKTRARELVLNAFELGWEGPPFNPIMLAQLLHMDVVPNDSIVDACLIPTEGSYQIQYNPYQRPTRINFSVAHEIAHTLFSDCSAAIRNRERHPYENRQLEQLCNAAASEIQLPYAIFSNDANSLEPSMDALINLANRYNASLESVFIRYTEVIDRPCAVLIGIFQDDNKIIIDYHKSSNLFSFKFPDYLEVPENSPLYECTSPGWTVSESEAQWEIFSGNHFNLFAIGISPYRRDNKPRIGVLVLPSKEARRDEQMRKVSLEYGDATKPRGKGKKIIAQVVNTSAALGRGFGYSLAKNYPIIKDELQKWRSDKSKFILGNANLIKVDSNTYVFQMLAQKGIFATATEIPLRYNELRKCLQELRKVALDLNCSIHMPAIGAGQAQGNWEIIIGMIHDELVSYNLKVNIYLLPGKPISQKNPSNLTSFKEDSTWESGKLF